jgi:hypothetical protein
MAGIERTERLTELKDNSRAGRRGGGRAGLEKLQRRMTQDCDNIFWLWLLQALHRLPVEVEQCAIRGEMRWCGTLLQF